ncbi:4-hydroxybenzoate octaprenyltransferase [Achromobacter sp. GG226]|uniref:4-hydroxybenzoate octaprenyltransferase n=1 Tax=Verticiella alkaliphila TaxID=2779529 RepID=UPI001C0E852C|nr:4-hydroxybenzoate octaprenyltransferase [Verticiella sp. GG226]MBU4612724.1 4-hydroxybenzoate octaprenyltransferase [Verticiella sp. GG226]
MSTAAASRLSLYIRLVRLDKPIGILLLLWPTLTAVWIAADGRPEPHIVFIFVVGTVLMRSAGCAINDYFDRDFDKHVERTQARVLTTGLISPREALAVAGTLALVSALLVLPLNGLTWALACVALFVAITYPLLKRVFAIPQAYLGVAFGFGIPMAFAAVQGVVPWQAWVLLLANVAWAVAYDTEYAMVDREDDLKLGLRTSAITFGQWDVAIVAICYAVTLLLMAVAGVGLELGFAYYAGLVVAGAIAVRHIGWIRTRDRGACFRAFLHNTWFGFAVFAGAAVATSLR